ncbi:MAG: flavin-dependent dehydrogenase [Leptolyngbya sp. SIO4C5]|nr:flavin-dependent dehydrogenase [Leptolyngbya sp. SIO4C5]
MQEVLYTEIPTPDVAAVKAWLQDDFTPATGQKYCTPDGIRLEFSWPKAERSQTVLPPALSIIVWSLQRTTYLKAFRWTTTPLPQENLTLQRLTAEIRQQFPQQYPTPPEIDLAQQSIFDALGGRYPKTVQYFQRMPNGEADLKRAYWWEKRWRESVKTPQQPAQVLFKPEEVSAEQRQVLAQAESAAAPVYDLIYVGGALGILHAAVMASLGYRVLLIERLPFGRMNREWNISREEFQSLIDLGLFTPAEFESLIAREYQDGFNKFFDSNNPAVAKAPILHTPRVLNIALDSDRLLAFCGEKFTAAGGTIWDETEFCWAEIEIQAVTVLTQSMTDQQPRAVRGRLLVDAMGTASPIAWQLNGGRAFDSVCPTVGASISGGFEPGVWDSAYGDVLFSHGDISKGRQLIWELFPGRDDELTIYLFHYHQVNPENPGSLLEMYEDFFTILPEYRRCNLDKLTWRKPTFGYIPGHFSVGGRDRQVAFDRLIAIGDAASLQSPLVFTGFGSLVRNLPRLSDLLHFALRHDLLQRSQLDQIRAFQSNIAVTWLFSKGMMVPTGQTIAPQRINSMLNTFFGVLGQESPETANRFIKDRFTWLEFNRMALRAAWHNPALLKWIWQLAGPQDLGRWLGSYLNFTFSTFWSWFFSWLPWVMQGSEAWLERLSPAIAFWLKARSYEITYGMGRPLPVKRLIEPDNLSSMPNVKQSRKPSSPASAAPSPD